jgi:hypothetical protein
MSGLGQFFVTPIEISGIQKVLLLLPLCLSISIIYKVTRCERLADVPAAVGALWVTIVVGMHAVGVGLWVVYLVVV